MSRNKVLLNTKNFAVYYGVGREEELSKFDLAIVEPEGHDKEGIGYLHSSGTIVLAYLSAMEIINSSPDFRLLREEDLLIVEGKPVINPEYGTNLVRLDSTRWSSILLHKAGYFLTQLGYDGLFIDTAGDVELHVLSEQLKHEQALAAAAILDNIRSLFPDCLIIQNNGIEKLCQYTADFIDGICWENPPFHKKESDLWCREVLKRFALLKKHQGIRSLLLVVNDGEISEKNLPFAGKDISLAYKTAIAEGFLIYAAPKHYLGRINPPLDIL